MKTTVVVYRSKSGFTEKYARWIAEETGADLMKTSETKLEDLLQYGTVVYGGGLYAGGINGVKLITGHLGELAGKKLIVFGVGASPCRPNTAEEVRNANFTGEAREKIHFFLLRGGFDLSKCNLKDKMLMNLLKVKLEKAPETDKDAKGMLACYDHPADFTDKKAIEPILDCMKSAQ
ncbi:flavodoxin domain-containing protein [Caproiciproducens faecalis]|uniref:Flavodoxin n=1 Tax=Caproiciproducens faecalis TaxID=2820301 RepID=A0ABS7DLT3_9FIRM|nr:flavodoxin domain-containing protein [Caproiciproducens faecalis]MBW7572247.1 flavodoxin [Caproiciproducens faecalis]